MIEIIIGILRILDSVKSKKAIVADLCDLKQKYILLLKATLYCIFFTLQINCLLVFNLLQRKQMLINGQSALHFTVIDF